VSRWLSMLVILLTLVSVPALEAEESSARADGTAARLREAKALRARSRRYLEAAVAGYRAVLRRDPRSLEAQRGLARALRDQGAEEEALPYLREVAGRSEAGVDYVRLAWALFRSGRWAEAADAFAEARKRGQDDAETARGAALAAATARAALDLNRGPEAGSPSPVSSASAPPPSGLWRPWHTFLNATGTIVSLVQYLLFGLIAVVIVGGVAVRSWGALMGRDAPRDEEGMRLRQFRRLPVRDVQTGRLLGRVRQVVYDPKLARLVGFRTGGRWRWRVLPLTAVRGVGHAGLLIADAAALVQGDQAGELGELARVGTLPLGPGRRLKRVLTEDGTLVAYARPDCLWIDGATGQVTFEVSPNRFHHAWRVALSALQLGPVDWLMGRMLDQGLALLPGRLSVRLRLPAHLIRSANRHVVIVSGETADWIEQHFQQLEVEAQFRLAQVKEGVARARPVVEAGVARARPMVEAGVAKAKPVLEKARDSGVALARRSAEGVVRTGKAGVEALARRQGEPAETSPSAEEQRPTGTG
jgi:hypothetical protein